MTKPRCVDCLKEGVTTNRPVTHGGPRSPLCTTHWRMRRKTRSARAHELRTERGYGITGAEYKLLYEAQGGKCAICQRATGATKRLSVDHDHNKEGCQHAPDVGCHQCVRGLVCSGNCNRILLGRYDVHALARAIMYILDPPAQKVLNPRHEETNDTTG